MADPIVKDLARQAFALSLQPFRGLTEVNTTPISRQIQAAPLPAIRPPAPPSMTAYEPTTRERLASGGQSMLEVLGLSRPQARRISQTIVGGKSAALPIGLLDVVPGIGTVLQAEEAGRGLQRAGQFAESGQLGQAALEAGGSLLGMAPSLGGAIAKGRKAAFEVEEAYFDRLKNDYSNLKNEYAALKETKGGRILNTDEARELSPDYRADRTRSADVHEPSSELVKKIYEEKLSQPVPPGNEKTVIFTAGGTGAGKTTGLRAAEEVNEEVQKAQIVYDTNMSSFASADKKIQQALKANRDVHIIYTYRDPIDALENGALERASRMEREMGTGRTVPLKEHLKTHVGARKVMEQLQEKYKNTPEFTLTVIDNSLGKNNAAFTTLDKLPRLEDNRLEKGLSDALENAYRTGKISRAIYEGTRSNGQ